jgi:hypothetical protein
MQGAAVASWIGALVFWWQLRPRALGVRLRSFWWVADDQPSSAGHPPGFIASRVGPLPLTAP